MYHIRWALSKPQDCYLPGVGSGAGAGAVGTAGGAVVGAVGVGYGMDVGPRGMGTVGPGVPGFGGGSVGFCCFHQ